MPNFKNLRSRLILIVASGIVLFVLVLAAANTFGLTFRNKLVRRSIEKEQANLPPAIDYSENRTEEPESNDEGLVIIPNEPEKQNVSEPKLAEKQETTPAIVQPPQTVNLNVPFTSQAPSGNWDLPFKEACEEASILMMDKFYKGQSFANASETEDEIKNIVDFEEHKLNFHLDTDAQETAQVLNNYFGYQNVRVVDNITVNDIKKELAQGRPVIVPAAGRMLGNPYYRQPGPLYHMLVVKGYTATKFITNDPGTRRGKDFTYSFDTLYNAIHDWNNGNVNEGKKTMIVVEQG